MAQAQGAPLSSSGKETPGSLRMTRVRSPSGSSSAGQATSRQRSRGGAWADSGPAAAQENRNCSRPKHPGSAETSANASSTQPIPSAARKVAVAPTGISRRPGWSGVSRAGFWPGPEPSARTVLAGASQVKLQSQA